MQADHVALGAQAPEVQAAPDVDGRTEERPGGRSAARLTVEYYHQAPGFYGNIIWAERDRGDSYYRYSRFAKRKGQFPPDHPAAGGADPVSSSMQMGSGDKMAAFRARGYWASCFPEGDGISMKGPDGCKAADVVRDIEEIFGWQVVVKRGDAA